MDHFRKGKSLFSTTSNSFGTGEGVSITLSSSVGLPTDTEMVLTFDREVQGKLERILGTVSGSNFVVSTGGRGYDGTTEQSHTSPVVEYIYNAADQNDWIDGMLEEHNQDGTHDATKVATASASDISGFAWVKDEDDMASDSDTAVPTQQSVKAYVDNNATSTDGWTEYSAVVPTRTTADDPTYVVTFSGVDLTDRISVGMKVKWTQNSTVRYGIVTAIAFSTNTTLTLYGGTDYDVDDTATHVISAFNYSPHKSPFGFPMSPAKWTILLSTTTGTQTPPTQNTWHNLGGSGALHIGDWYVRFWAGAYTDTGTAGVKVTQITVSTANNSESDATYTIAQTDYDIKSATCMASWVRNFTVASKTTYFVNARTTQASQSNLGITRNRLEAVCAYL